MRFFEGQFTGDLIWEFEKIKMEIQQLRVHSIQGFETTHTHSELLRYPKDALNTLKPIFEKYILYATLRKHITFHVEMCALPCQNQNQIRRN